MLTGQGPEESLQTLAKQAEIVIIKCGSKGSWIKSGAEEVFVPCSKVDVVDTTAAGDMYAGGFMHGLLSGVSLEECGQIATFCAESVIQQVGARMPDDLLEQVKGHLNKEAVTAS